MSDKGLRFTFLTFFEIEPKLEALDDLNIKVVPVYQKINQNKSKLINYIKSFLIPLYFKNEFKDIDVIKQNQLNGAWVSIILKIFVEKAIIN